MFVSELFYGERDKYYSPNRRFQEAKRALEKGVEDAIGAYVKINKKT